MTHIHPTAIVDTAASIGEGVSIGPFTIIEAGAVIGDRTKILSSAFVAGCCEIGPDCEIHTGALVGGPPQMLGMKGAGGRVRVGAGTIVREHVTIHRATDDAAATTVGEGCFLLANSHIAHDCRVGNEVVLANGALLAGHVSVGDRAFVSGNAVVHQFARIGRLAMIGGGSRVAKDVVPFTMVVNDSEVYGLNTVGLRRAGFNAAERQELKRIFRTLYRSSLNLSQALDVLRGGEPSSVLTEILTFIEGSKRGLCAGGPRGRRMKSAARDTDDDR